MDYLDKHIEIHFDQASKTKDKSTWDLSNKRVEDLLCKGDHFIGSDKIFICIPGDMKLQGDYATFP